MLAGRVALGVVLAACVLVTATGRGENDASLPTLRGEEAIEQLKQAGEYDSLAAAVNAARREHGQLEEPAAPNVFGQSAKLVAADRMFEDAFGDSVAISGDTVVVGAPGDDIGGSDLGEGSAYVFTRSGGVWSQQQKLTASDRMAGDGFGFRVAIDGETIVVGAAGDDVGDNSNQGSAYVFTRSGSVWTQQQKLTAADGATNDQFGYSVAISGDTSFVGAASDDTMGGTDAGSAYVFTRSGGVWSQQQKLTASDGAAADRFGRSVAIGTETAVVGAPTDDVGANSDQGSAYVFIRSGSVWTQQQKLTASNGAAGDFFGVSVAISGETAVVGVSFDDVGANSNQGSACVFTRSGSVWTQQAQLFANGGAAQDLFGIGVTISGDTAIVGAEDDDVGATAEQGSAYVFTRSGGVWTQQTQLLAADGGEDDNFGTSVAISGNTVVVGAPEGRFGGVPGEGAAYIFVDGAALQLTAAVSRKAHGTAGSFSIPLPLINDPGVECRSSGGAHTLVFTFSNSVVSGNASVTTGVGSVSGSPAFSTNTMTVNLSGVADVQKITVTLSGVTDSAGTVLPNTAVSMNMLIGDINASKVVNASDIGAVKAQSGLPVTATNFRADVAVSGGITASDIGLVKSRSGASVP